MKSKILVITTVPETLETILQGQLNFLSKHHDMYAVSSPSMAKVSKNESVKCYEVKMYRGIAPLKDIVSIYKLFKIIKRLKPDVCHSYTPKAGLVTAIAAFLCRVPTRIHTFTGLIFPTKKGLVKFVLKSLDKLVVGLNTKIVCEGKGVLTQLLDNGFNQSKLSIIGNGNIAGVDLNYFTNQNNYNYSSGKNFIFIGRLNKDKGVFELLESFSKLPKNNTLTIVGSIDESAPPEQISLDKIYSLDNVVFLGFLKDIRGALGEADCLILPSYREGFPNVVLQAGAMGKPCIVTNVPGSNEIIMHGINGWVVSPRNIDELELAMLQFIQLSDKEIQSMSNNARVNICEKYCRDFYLKELLSFYRGCSNHETCL